MYSVHTICCTPLNELLYVKPENRECCLLLEKAEVIYELPWKLLKTFLIRKTNEKCVRF